MTLQRLLSPSLALALFALLVCNTAYYVASEAYSKGLDSVAWLALLALFLLETSYSQELRSTGAPFFIRSARLFAAAAVFAAGVAYISERDWLDAINTALWIGVVIVLELEVRKPHVSTAYRRSFAVTATALYTGLGVLVVIWATRGEWFDAYDAALWLAAFVFIEMELLAAKPAQCRGVNCHH